MHDPALGGLPPIVVPGTGPGLGEQHFLYNPRIPHVMVVEVVEYEPPTRIGIETFAPEVPKRSGRNVNPRYAWTVEGGDDGGSIVTATVELRAGVRPSPGGVGQAQHRLRQALLELEQQSAGAGPANPAASPQTPAPTPTVSPRSRRLHFVEFLEVTCSPDQVWQALRDRDLHVHDPAEWIGPVPVPGTPRGLGERHFLYSPSQRRVQLMELVEFEPPSAIAVQRIAPQVRVRPHGAAVNTRVRWTINAASAGSTTLAMIVFCEIPDGVPVDRNLEANTRRVMRSALTSVQADVPSAPVGAAG